MERATKFVALQMSRELVSPEISWNEAIVAIAFTEERMSAGEVKNFLPGAMPMVRGDDPHTGNDRSVLSGLYKSLLETAVGPFRVAVAFHVGDRIVVPRCDTLGDIEHGSLYTVVTVRTQWTSRDNALARKMGYKNGCKQVGKKPNERAIWYRFKAPPIRKEEGYVADR